MVYNSLQFSNVIFFPFVMSMANEAKSSWPILAWYAIQLSRGMELLNLALYVFVVRDIPRQGREAVFGQSQGKQFFR